MTTKSDDYEKYCIPTQRIWPTSGKKGHVFYAPPLYRQVLLRRVLAMGILSVCPSVCHDPVQKQPSEIETPGFHHMIA